MSDPEPTQPVDNPIPQAEALPADPEPVDPPVSDPPAPEPIPLPNPFGLKRFTGVVPDGYATIGLFSQGRVIETLFLIPIAHSRTRLLTYSGVDYPHVSDGPDGRWQYGDNRG